MSILCSIAVWTIRDFVTYRHTVVINDTVVRVRVAHSPWQRRLGLGGTAYLCDTCGMLLRFDRLAPHALWMRGMIVSIDAIWISGGRVVDVAQNMQWWRGTADVRVSQKAADAAIEVPAGFVKTHNIRIGDAVIYGDVE